MIQVNTICQNDEPLPLTTKDNVLRIVFIGTGSAFTKRRRQSNILIIQGDHHVLVDCGTQGPLALTDVGLDVFKVRTYLPTHSHADHIGGYEEIMLSNRYVGDRSNKPQLIVLRDYQELLWSKSLSGGAEYCEANQGQSLQITDFFTILQPKANQIKGRKTWTYQHGPLELTLMRTRHFPDSAMNVDESQWCCGVMVNGKVWISGDTMFDLEYPTRFAKDTELMFHDCQLFQGGVHSSYGELLSLAPEIRKKMYLYHYNDIWKDTSLWVKPTDNFTGDPVKDGFRGWAEQQVAYDIT